MCSGGKKWCNLAKVYKPHSSIFLSSIYLDYSKWLEIKVELIEWSLIWKILISLEISFNNLHFHFSRKKIQTFLLWLFFKKMFSHLSKFQSRSMLLNFVRCKFDVEDSSFKFDVDSLCFKAWRLFDREQVLWKRS